MKRRPASNGQHLLQSARCDIRVYGPALCEVRPNQLSVLLGIIMRFALPRSDTSLFLNAGSLQPNKGLFYSCYKSKK